MSSYGTILKRQNRLTGAVIEVIDLYRLGQRSGWRWRAHCLQHNRIRNFQTRKQAELALGKPDFCVECAKTLNFIDSIKQRELF